MSRRLADIILKHLPNIKFTAVLSSGAGCDSFDLEVILKVLSSGGNGLWTVSPLNEDA